MKNIKSIILILLIAVGILFYINPLLKKTSTVVETAEIKTEVLTGTNFFKGSWAELLKKAKKENQETFSNALEKVKPIFTEQEWLKFEKIFQSNFKKHNS